MLKPRITYLEKMHIKEDESHQGLKLEREVLTGTSRI